MQFGSTEKMNKQSETERVLACLRPTVVSHKSLEEQTSRDTRHKPRLRAPTSEFRTVEYVAVAGACHTTVLQGRGLLI